MLLRARNDVQSDKKKKDAIHISVAEIFSIFILLLM